MHKKSLIADQNKINLVIRRILREDPTIIKPSERHFLERESFLKSSKFDKEEIILNDIKLIGRDAYIVKLLKKVAESLPIDSFDNIIELLPGTAEELSVAFSKAGYRKIYDKLDMFNFFSEDELYSVRKNFQALGFDKESEILISDVFLWASKEQKEYDAVIAKHPFDDLLIGQFAQDKGLSSFDYFRSPVNCKKSWKMLTQNYYYYLEKIIELAKNISSIVRKNGYFIVINHPDSFSTFNRMDDRLILAQDVTNRFITELYRNGFEFIENTAINDYNNNTYANSLFVLKKERYYNKKNDTDSLGDLLSANFVKNVNPAVVGKLYYQSRMEIFKSNSSQNENSLHNEVELLIDFICISSKRINYREKLIEEKIFQARELLRTKEGSYEAIKLIKSLLKILKIKTKDIIIYQNISPCQKRNRQISCKEIFSELGIKIRYVIDDSIEQQTPGNFKSYFVNLDKLHYMALYFLKKYDFAIVNGGHITVIDNKIKYLGGFCSFNNLLGLEEGILFVNIKNISIKKVIVKLKSENLKPWKIVVNVENDFDEEKRNDLVKALNLFSDDIEMVTYY